MKVFFCLAILVTAVCAAPFEGGASGSQAGANAATQTFQQGGGTGFFPHGGFVPFTSGTQAGASAQTTSFHQGGGVGGFGPNGAHGPTPYGFGVPASFGASGATAGAQAQTFNQGGHGGGTAGSQAVATAQTQTFHT